MSAFVRAYRDDGRPWYEAGQPSAGNGALMRIAPVLLPHLPEPSRKLWEDVIVATALTHNDEAAVAASVGFVGLLCECLAWSDEQAPAAEWWLDTFLRYARPVETGKPYSPRSRQIRFEGTIRDFVERFVRPAVRDHTTPLEACERWYSAAYLLETVPAALVILASHGDDPEEAIIRLEVGAPRTDAVRRRRARVRAPGGGATGLPDPRGGWGGVTLSRATCSDS